MKFSDRIGVTKRSEGLLMDQVPPDLRTTLWNWIWLTFPDRNDWIPLTQDWFTNFFKRPLDDVPGYPGQCRDVLKQWFTQDTTRWFELYNFVDHILRNNLHRHSRAIDNLNSLLERELSGYRVINGQLAPITHPVEISAIAQASGLSGDLAAPAKHIGRALELLGQKPTPDYRNSIKESISAVEGVTKVLAAQKAGGLEAALKRLTASVDLHPAMVKGFVNLYGFTSDADGIRHPMLETSTVGFAEAKYMLVTCSAFVHFVTSKAQDAGLLKNP